MPAQRFIIVDVFAEKVYAGNQLAVFVEAGSLSADQMQVLAREMNFAESSFVLSGEERNGGFDVRIFTPQEEVPFAGHPTLGTAWVIRQEILREPREKIVLNLAVGQIPVTFGSSAAATEPLWMHQKRPMFGETVPAEEVAALLGLEREEIDTRFPAQEVSTGIPFLIVPLKDLAAVKKSSLHKTRYEELIRTRGMKAVFLFSPQTYSPKNQINARMFADHFGVPEDPATGSATGCLGGYLVRHRYLGGASVEARVEQGYEIGRPSLLHLRAEETPDGVEIFVGGRVFPVARGELL